MRNRIDCARLVFEDVQREYAEGPAEAWLFGSADTAKLGLSKEEIDRAVQVLVHKGILKPAGLDDYDVTDRFHLTHLGVELCMHPELLEGALSPQVLSGPPAAHVTINADNVQNTQIGNHNAQNVTYLTVLESLKEKSKQRRPALRTSKARGT